MSISPVRFIRDVQLGVKNLMLHKLRSFLTMLGLVFGVGSVIAMLAVGEGASEVALEQMDSPMCGRVSASMACCMRTCSVWKGRFRRSAASCP